MKPEQLVILVGASVGAVVMYLLMVLVTYQLLQ